MLTIRCETMEKMDLYTDHDEGIGETKMVVNEGVAAYGRSSAVQIRRALVLPSWSVSDPYDREGYRLG